MSERNPTQEYDATVTLRQRPDEATIDNLLDALVGLGPVVRLSDDEANALMTVDAPDAESARIKARAAVEPHCGVEAIIIEPTGPGAPGTHMH